jgi:signal peptidase I
MEPRKENFIQEVVKFSLIALLIVLPIRLYVAQPFIVRGASMEPTFHTGDYVIIDQLTYKFEDAKRGDVIIFRHPDDESVFLIKRVVGLPGETIEIIGKQILIHTKDGKTSVLEEPYIEDERLSTNFLSVTLTEDEYFVMGDNRRESSDSRIWGALPAYEIIGRAFVRLYPVSDIGVFPGFSAEQLQEDTSVSE